MWLDDIGLTLGAAICRAYNSWLSEYCSRDPSRLKGIALVPVYDPPQAVAELRRAKQELGMAGFMWRPNPIRGRTLDHPDYDPIYRAAEELEMPVLVHEGDGALLPDVGEGRSSDFSRHVVRHPMEQMLACVALCADGVLERFPDLKVGFMESGCCGWAPFLVERMDEHWEHYYFGGAHRTKEPPSVYFNRQCYASCETNDEFIGHFMEHFGHDRIVTATDYPHPDAVDKFPDLTIAEFVRRPALSAETKRRILWDNPARLYGITAFPPVSS